MLRLVFVLSSIAPLFVLWAVKGITLISDPWFLSACALLAVLPTLLVLLREQRARVQRHVRQITVERYEDQRNHILVYLFAILLPFYRQDVTGWRDLSALIAALVFVVFLFWHLKLHYLNIVFAIRGYHTFTIYPAEATTKYARREGCVLVTRRSNLAMGESIVALRLAHDLYFEEDS